MGVQNVRPLAAEEAPQTHEARRVGKRAHPHVEDRDAELLDPASDAAVVVQAGHNEVEAAAVEVAEAFEQAEFGAADLQAGDQADDLERWPRAAGGRQGFGGDG